MRSVYMTWKEIEVYSQTWKTKKFVFQNPKNQNWQNYKKGFFEKYLDSPKLCSQFSGKTKQ